MEVVWLSYSFAVKRSAELEINIQGQNLRCYHLNDGCGHE